MNHKAFFPLIVFWLTLLVFSCKQKTEESPISGDITIYCDETFRPIIDAEIATFEALYRNARVKAVFLPENKAFEKLLQDSTELIITGRKLSGQEMAFFSSEQALVNEFHFATDAIALITSQKFNNYLTDSSNLRSLFNGTFARWKDLNTEWSADSIMLVIDQSNSANLRFVLDQFDLRTEKTRVYSAGSDSAVLAFVRRHPNALGVIGSTFISDEEAISTRQLREGVHFIQIRNEKASYGPEQHSVADTNNPFSRRIYLIRRNKNTGLSAGFTSFLLSERGQRIVLKAGIMPAIMPGREIIVQ